MCRCCRYARTHAMVKVVMKVLNMRRLLFALALFLGMAATPAIVVAQDYQNLFRDFRSSDLSRADKRFLQAALAFEGHYNGLLDGDWGQISQRALEQYTWQEFGASAEDWHMAVLALSFFDIYKRDGWAVQQFEALGLSMLYPFNAVRNEPPTNSFVNWRHTNSSVGYSIGARQSERSDDKGVTRKSEYEV